MHWDYASSYFCVARATATLTKSISERSQGNCEMLIAMAAFATPN